MSTAATWAPQGPEAIEQLEELTPQQVFDAVCVHLAQQGERSKLSDTPAAPSFAGCLYRGPRGLRCAVGALIRDHEYDPITEGQPVSCAWLPERLAPHTMLLFRLQRVHDTWATEDWPIMLEQVARDYELRFDCAQLPWKGGINGA